MTLGLGRPPADGTGFHRHTKRNLTVATALMTTQAGTFLQVPAAVPVISFAPTDGHSFLKRLFADPDMTTRDHMLDFLHQGAGQTHGHVAESRCGYRRRR